MARLPGHFERGWDTIMTGFLQVAHNADGTLKAFYSVKDFGAAGDGITDDTAAIQATINSLTGGGTAIFPPGTYLISATITVSSTIRLQGAGRNATILKKNFSGILLDLSGSAYGVANHTLNTQIEHMTLSGNNNTGFLVRMYYTSRARFYNIQFFANNNSAIQFVEAYDCRYIDCFFYYCSKTDGSDFVLDFENSVAASGFGYSPSNNNMHYFLGCHFEQFYGGAINVTAGISNTQTPNGLFFVETKIENQLIMGPFIQMDQYTRIFYINQMYISADSFNTGYSTPVAAIKANGGWSISDVYINAAGPYLASGVDVSASEDGCALNNIRSIGTACTVALVNFTGSSISKRMDVHDINALNGSAFANNTGGNQLYNFCSNENKSVVLSSSSSPYTPSVLNNGNTIFITVTGALTINQPNSRWQGAMITFVLTSDGTGYWNLAWDAGFKGLPLPSAMPAPNTTLSVTFISDGTSWYNITPFPTAPFALCADDITVLSNSALTAQVAYFASYELQAQVTVSQMRCQFSGTPTGNVDMGIYDSSGSNGAPGNLLGHTGAQAAATGVFTKSLSTNLVLSPGRYWLAWLDTVADSIANRTAIQAGMGVLMKSSSSSLTVLPSSAGSVVNTSARVGVMGLLLNGWS